MSEEIKLTFSEPQLLIDPHKKNIDPEEDVFLVTITGQVPQTNIYIGLAAWSHSHEDVKEFTAPFVARLATSDKDEDSEQSSTVVVIERKVDVSENDDRLLNNDLFLDITTLDLLHEGNSVVIELNIDPMIEGDHSHIFTFSARSQTDHIKVEAPMPRVSCKLYDSRQSAFAQFRSVRQAVQSNQAQIFVTNPSEASGGTRIGTYFEKSQLDSIIKNVTKPLWDKIVKTEPKETKLKDEFGTKDYALVVKGLGKGQEQSEYKITGRITMD
jgi:hypothetical protein